MTRKKRGCLISLIFAVLVIGAAIVAIMVLLPGDLSLGGSAPAPAPLTTSATSLAPGQTVPAPVEAPPAPSGWMTYLVPSDILQAELRKAFPIDQNVVDLVRLQLANPTFIEEPDPNFLRLRLDVEARVIEGGQRLPGTAVVRTRLAYNRDTRTVTLRQTQLVELSFSGAGASVAGALQPVLAAALSAEMEGYPIFEVPEDGLWWLKAGIGWVRDVYVKDGRVALSLGP